MGNGLSCISNTSPMAKHRQSETVSKSVNLGSTVIRDSK